MEQSPTLKARQLPSWVIALGSLLIAIHLLALGALALAAPSGPWPTSFGSDMAVGPQFAAAVNQVSADNYLKPLGMTHNYHFSSNRMDIPWVYFEVKLWDDAGREINTVRFPEEDANFWVRHRQRLLARNLGDDQPIQPSGPERVASPDQEVRKVHYWLTIAEARKLVEDDIIQIPLADLTEPKEKEVPAIPFGTPSADQKKEKEKKNYFVHVAIPEDRIGAVPRNRPMMGPSDWSLVLTRSYLRHLCRKYNAKSCELIRHSRDSVQPVNMYFNEPLPDSFSEMVASFGKRNLEELQR